jgi:hypothetical protein
VSLVARDRIGTGGAVTDVYVIVPRSEPSCATTETMRHGIPVSDALRYERPSQVPAYFCAGVSPRAHADKTSTAQSGARILDPPVTMDVEY